jgi:tetratricopeptide (TPR) repeat protein
MSGEGVSRAEDLRKQGNEFFNKGDLPKALDLFTSSLFAEKSHLTYQNRSLVYQRLGDNQNALRDARCAVELQATAKGYYRLAATYLALGKYAEALRSCSDGLVHSPDSSDLLSLRVKAQNALVASNSLEGADSDDEEDEEDEEEDEDEDEDDEDDEDFDDETDEEAEAEYHAQQAEARAHRFGAQPAPVPEPFAFSPPPPKPAAAPPKPAAPPVVAGTPLSAIECKERGNALYKAAQYEPSIGWYAKAADAATDDAERALYLCNQAAALVMVGRISEALSAASRASRLDPTNAKACARVGKCHLQLGQLTESRLALCARDRSARDRAGASAWRVRGSMRPASGRSPAHHDARRDAPPLRSPSPAAPAVALRPLPARRAAPPRPAPCRPPARAHELSPETAGVASDLHSIKLAEALAEEAATHAAAAEHDKAVSALRLLLSRYCPHSEHFKFLELDSIVHLGRYDEVLSQATAMLRRSPDSSAALYLRGRCMFHNGQLDAALKHAAEALRLEPDHAPAKALRLAVKALLAEKEGGNDAFKRGDYAAAIDRYTAALALCGERDQIRGTLHVNRATAHARARSFVPAIADCTAALALDGKNVKAILRRAQCHLDLEHFDKAISDYDLAAAAATDEEGQRAVRARRGAARLAHAQRPRAVARREPARTFQALTPPRASPLSRCPARAAGRTAGARLEAQGQAREAQGRAHRPLQGPRDRAQRLADRD